MKGNKTQKLLSLLTALAAAAMLVPAPSAAALSSSDEYYGYQWALKNDGSFSPSKYGVVSAGGADKSTAGIDINVESAWGAYTPKRRVIVALIDTGADTSWSDLTGHLWVNPGEIAGNGVDDDGNGYVDDCNGWNFRDGTNVLHTSGHDSHGTHCFGTIAAACNSSGVAGICGYTDMVKVMVLKAFGDSSGSTSDIVKAITYAKANGASIVNLSLGLSDYNDTLYTAMKNSGMLFVAAAGNSGGDTAVSPMYPAAYDLDNIISVANLNFDGTLNSTSNYGSDVDIAAPGTTILGYGAEDKLYYMTGTSMSAPMVAGAAALIYSGTEGLSLAQVREAILKSAKPLASLAGKVATGGMLDTGAALEYAVSASSKSASPVFSDVGTGDWFYSYVTKLAAAGVVAGYEDGTFRPNNSVSVGEALALVFKAAGYEYQPPTDGHWASGYRDKALSMGVVKSEDVQNLDAAASRLLIARASAGILGLSPDSGPSPFADTDDPLVTALYNAGVVAGSFDADGRRVFLPGTDIKRSEMSVIVCRMMK